MTDDKTDQATPSKDEAPKTDAAPAAAAEAPAAPAAPDSKEDAKDNAATGKKSKAKTVKDDTPAGAATVPVAFKATGSYSGSAQISLSDTIEQALTKAGIKDVKSLQLRNAGGKAVKLSDSVSESVTYPTGGGWGEVVITVSPKMQGG